MAAILGLIAGRLAAETPRCGGHGGVAGCDTASMRLICKDGALDMRFPCTMSVPGKSAAPRSGKSSKKIRAHVVKFKPATTHGQILSPGDPTPVSTIEQSKKDLSR